MCRISKLKNLDRNQNQIKVSEKYYINFFDNKVKDFNVIKKDITVQNIKVEALIDTGAQISVMSLALFKRLNLKSIKTDVKLFGLDGKELRNIGKVKCAISLNSKIIVEEVIISGIQNYEFILGMDLLHKLDAIIDVRNYEVVGTASIKTNLLTGVTHYIGFGLHTG